MQWWRMSEPRAMSRVTTLALTRRLGNSGQRRQPGSGATRRTSRSFDHVQNRCEKQHEEIMQAQYAITRAEYERELDAAIAGSFPASDPPPWTLGASSWMDLEAPVQNTGSLPAVTEVIVRDGYRVGGIRLASLGEAIALAAMVPLAILIAGVPVAALIWGIANAVTWLAGNI